MVPYTVPLRFIQLKNNNKKNISFAEISCLEIYIDTLKIYIVVYLFRYIYILYCIHMV